MFIREDPKKLADGTEVRYVSLAHNVWVEGKNGGKHAKPVIYARLGRAEELDDGVLSSMSKAIERYRAKRFGTGSTEGEVAREVRGEAPTLRQLASRCYGVRALVEAAWASSGLASVLHVVARQHVLSWDLERVVFAMVLHRLAEPGSKLACNEWIGDEAWFPEAEGWDVHLFYRALDFLDVHDDEVRAGLAQAALASAEPDDLRLLLTDTTSTYFDTEADDSDLDHPLRLRGHSKDHRPDRPQVLIGLTCSASGRVLHHEVLPGNTSDQKVTVELVDAARARLPGARVVAVCDSGMGGSPNLAALDERGVDRVTGVPLRVSKVAEEAVLARPGRWRRHPDKPQVSWRLVELDEGRSPSSRPELWIATRNANEAAARKVVIDRHVARVEAILKRGDRFDEHDKHVCGLLTHPTLRRYVRRSADGHRVLLDRDAVARERRRAGVKVIRSTLVDLDPLVSLDAYEALQRVERNFRTLKGAVRLRPVFHHAPRRVRAHVLVCMAALVVMQEIEHRTGRSYSELRKLFRGIRATQLEQGTTRFWVRGELPEGAEMVLDRLGSKPGAASWGAERVHG